MSSIAPTEVWFELAKNYADSESPEVNVDGSITAQYFDIKGTDANDLCELHRVCIEIVDGSITPIKFAGLSALTNGLKVQLVDANDVEIIDFLDGLTLKQNADWGLLAGVDNTAYAAPADDHFPVRWTMSKAFHGQAIEMLGGVKMRFTVQDNLSGITIFRIMGQGMT